MIFDLQVLRSTIKSNGITNNFDDIKNHIDKYTLGTANIFTNLRKQIRLSPWFLKQLTENVPVAAEERLQQPFAFSPYGAALSNRIDGLHLANCKTVMT